MWHAVCIAVTARADGRWVRRLELNDMRPRSAAAMMATVLLVPASTAHAQVPLDHGVDLDDVIGTVLVSSPEIERGRLAVDAEAGARLVAASPFDLEVRTGLLSAHESLPLAGVRDGLLVTETVETSASAVKSFRSGVVVSSDFSLGRVRSSTVGLPVDQVRSSVSFLVPLGGGRGGGALAGAERAAQESYAASRFERHHVVARVVHDAVLAYWLYLAAHEQLRTYVESADRARRLVDETEVLIRADERPVSDRDLMASNLAQKETAVTAARQTLVDAKYALGIAMGLAADGVSALGPPLTGFPEISVDSRVAVTAAARVAMVGAALSARRDLSALQARRTGARLAWEGALRDMRPRWDVLTRFGYTGVSSARGMGAASSFAQGAGGMNGLLQVQFEPVVTNRAVRGGARRAAALHRVAAVAAEDLVRRIDANVRVALEAFNNGAQEALAAHEAVRLSELSVITEQEKFRLGLATLFDAILAEDSLTNARLRQTNALFRFAAALVRLRFESATLLESAGGRVTVDSMRMTSFAFEEPEP